MAKNPTGEVKPFPRNPAGYKAATKEAMDLSDYAQGLNQYTTDRNDEAPDMNWNPKKIGAEGAHRGFEMRPQVPGGKGSKTRASF